MKKPLWEPKPEDIEKTNLTRFSKKIQEKYNVDSANSVNRLSRVNRVNSVDSVNRA